LDAQVSSEDEARGENEAAVDPLPLPRFGVVVSGFLSVLVTSSLVLLPPLGLLIAPLALIPVAQHVAARRRGVLVWGWVVLLMAMLALRGVALLGIPVLVYLLVYLLVVVLPMASLELWQSTGTGEGRWAAVTTLTASGLCMAALAAAASPRSPVEAVSAWWQQAGELAQESYEAAGVPSGQMELVLDEVAGVAHWILPAMPVAYLVVILFWIRPRLPMLGFVMPVAPFEEFRIDEWLPAVFAAAGIGALVLDGSPRWAAVNLLIAVLMLYFVQGLAIIRAHLARWIGRGWLVRWGVALLCLQGPLPLLVATLGIADGFYSLRPRVEKNGGEA
jgi:hypothetical protein